MDDKDYDGVAKSWKVMDKAERDDVMYFLNKLTVSINKHPTIKPSIFHARRLLLVMESLAVVDDSKI